MTARAATTKRLGEGGGAAIAERECEAKCRRIVTKNTRNLEEERHGRSGRHHLGFAVKKGPSVGEVEED